MGSEWGFLLTLFCSQELDLHVSDTVCIDIQSVLPGASGLEECSEQMLTHILEEREFQEITDEPKVKLTQSLKARPMA